MNQNTERRAAPERRARKSLVRGPIQVLAALGLMAAAFTWASQSQMTVGKPGERLSLPGSMISAPSTAHFAYLSQALGDDEARRLEPVTARVAAVLKRYARDATVADRAAAAVVAEGEKHKLDPSLLIGLMIIENSRIEPDARSNVGATGLMQVMPFHSGKWGCDSPNLANIESNICHGVNILAQYVRTSPTLDRALLRYNGCVRGRNTPNCFTYPRKVKGYAQHAKAMMTAMEQGRDIRSISLFPRSSTVKASASGAARKTAPRKSAQRRVARS